MLRQYPDGVANILTKGIQEVQPPGIAALVLHSRETAASTPRLLGAHAGCTVFFDRAIEMDAQFPFECIVDADTAQE